MLRQILDNYRRQNKSIGFVPTMGAFHKGHLSLMRRCRKDHDIALVSIFVNPTQFAPGEDLSSYPRNKKNDVLLAKEENIDIIFYPSVKKLYSGRYLTHINVGEISEELCGKTRPNHFQGVATIVGKLINIVQPHVLYLGQKDAQQSVVIQQMVQDLNFPVKIKVLPTTREKNGLAMSSRNKYLSVEERKQASVLYNSLLLAKIKINAGQRNANAIIKSMRRNITENASCSIEYIACVDTQTLKPLKKLRGKILIALAVRFGHARLIDNILINMKD